MERKNRRTILSIATLFLFATIFLGCNKSEKIIAQNQEYKREITCTEIGCAGFYKGPEFINNDDIAHQFSNKMAAKVGEKLKEFYLSGNYCKVDFDKIEMYTKGMGSGNVRYELVIPFEKVADSCDAFTSFDHVGGWNHKPALEERKLQLQKGLQKRQELNVSSLKSTPEGLQEYWIQWKNKDLQKECF